ncbi:MAG: hypothetical protein KKH01_03895 [Firmicutes bacterium]|nr:hypothetical protein [Bacillota bacterium]
MLLVLVTVSIVLYFLYMIVVTKVYYSSDYRKEKSNKVYVGIYSILVISLLVVYLLKLPLESKVLLIGIITFAFLVFNIVIGVKYIKALKYVKEKIKIFDIYFISIFSLLWLPITIFISLERILSSRSIIMLNISTSISLNMFTTLLALTASIMAYYLYFISLVFPTSWKKSSYNLYEKFSNWTAHLIILALSLVVGLFLMAEFAVNYSSTESIALYDRMFSIYESIIISLLIPAIFSILLNKNTKKKFHYKKRPIYLDRRNNSKKDE